MKKISTQQTVLILVAVLAVAGVVWAVTRAPSKAADPAASAPKPALTVTTAQPQTTQLPITLSANGNITAWQEAVVGSESNGLRLSEVRVNVGDTVRAGQVLASFAAESVLADVAQTKANLAEAEANALDAAGNAERARSLQATGALSTQQINQYETSAQTAKARVDAARATLAVQQLRLKHTQVLAPDGGVISARSATVGAVVPSGTELFRLIRQGRLEWRAEVTSSELGRLPVGTAVALNAANGAQVTGKVRTLAPTVDLQTRAALVYVDLPANAAVKAGMFAKGEFNLGMSGALTVPQQAVVVRDGFSHVFRLNADSRVSQVKVQAGRRLGDRVEVLDGLTPDTMLVVSGAGFLNDGDLVKNVPVSEANTPPALVKPADAASK
ncbi:MAG: efflux RND transporter periplasmic adaptor subunit [Pseudomonadota bacterium]